ncbi:MAG: hypothetical protein OXJ64_21055, partial [Boseongicola sp.]|nr:hypothetical protein [Boseongicola sp.]
MALVHQVAQAVMGVLVARWCDIQAAPRGQLQARGTEVQLDAILVAVANPDPSSTVNPRSWSFPRSDPNEISAL